MTTLPLDTLSDVSLSDSSSTHGQTTISEQCQSVPPDRNSIVKKHRKRKKKRFNGDPSLASDPEVSGWWKRRYDLFERFDEGIQLDKVSWYSVTPEEIARRQAEVCRCDLIIDGFAGAGGNSVQFAQKCGFVISIDNSLERLNCLINNAMVYGVRSKIDNILGDLATVLAAIRTGKIAAKPTPLQSKDCMQTHLSNSAIVTSPKLKSNDLEELSSEINPTENVDLFVPDSGRTSHVALSTTLTPLQSGDLASAEVSYSIDPSQSDNQLEVKANDLENVSSGINPIDHVDLNSVQLVTEAGETLNIENNDLCQTSQYPAVKDVHLTEDTKHAPIVDVIFMSPPWGGPSYKPRVLPPGSSSWNRKRRKLWFESLSKELEPCFNLDDISILPKALLSARNLTSRVCIYLPRNTAVGQILKLGWSDLSDSQLRVSVAIEDYRLRGRRMAVAAYVGNFPLLSTD